MVESGLFQFYISIKKYHEKINDMAYVKKCLINLFSIILFPYFKCNNTHSQFRNKVNDAKKLIELFKVFAGYMDSDESDIQPFTMNQLKRPIIFVLNFYGLATIIFLAECLVYKWNDWRDRKLHSDMKSFFAECHFFCFN